MVSEDPTGADYAMPATLEESIDQLGHQFDNQQAQLSALQSLLLDDRIAADTKPAGMPVHGYISSYFGVRPDPFDGHMARHTGIDISTPYGTPVHTVAEGMVTFAGVRHGYGNVVEIDHGNGYMTRYAHNSKLLVHPGAARAGWTGDRRCRINRPFNRLSRAFRSLARRPRDQSAGFRAQPPLRDQASPLVLPGVETTPRRCHSHGIARRDDAVRPTRVCSGIARRSM